PVAMSRPRQFFWGDAKVTIRSRLWPCAWGRLVMYSCAFAPNSFWESDRDMDQFRLLSIATRLSQGSGLLVSVCAAEPSAKNTGLRAWRDHSAAMAVFPAAALAACPAMRPNTAPL